MPVGVSVEVESCTFGVLSELVRTKADISVNAGSVAVAVNAVFDLDALLIKRSVYKEEAAAELVAEIEVVFHRVLENDNKLVGARSEETYVSIVFHSIIVLTEESHLLEFLVSVIAGFGSISLNIGLVVQHSDKVLNILQKRSVELDPAVFIGGCGKCLVVIAGDVLGSAARPVGNLLAALVKVYPCIARFVDVTGDLIAFKIVEGVVGLLCAVALVFRLGVLLYRAKEYQLAGCAEDLYLAGSIGLNIAAKIALGSIKTKCVAPVTAAVDVDNNIKTVVLEDAVLIGGEVLRIDIFISTEVCGNELTESVGVLLYVVLGVVYFELSSLIYVVGTEVCCLRIEQKLHGCNKGIGIQLFAVIEGKSVFKNDLISLVLIAFDDSVFAYIILRDVNGIISRHRGDDLISGEIVVVLEGVKCVTGVV